MNLIYNSDTINPERKGQPVKVGDDVLTSDGETVRVEYFRPPHKPSSSGKVTLSIDVDHHSEYYVSVIGAEWVNREDRTNEIVEA